MTVGRISPGSHARRRRATRTPSAGWSSLLGRPGPVRALGGREADAEDVVQESLVAAWRDLAGLRDPARVRAWLTAIVFRRAVRARRWWRLRAALDEVRARAARPTPRRA